MYKMEAIRKAQALYRQTGGVTAEYYVVFDPSLTHDPSNAYYVARGDEINKYWNGCDIIWSYEEIT